jgi:phosphoglycerol transferase MdoB-like AlkP superfamily enzyme
LHSSRLKILVLFIAPVLFLSEIVRLILTAKELPLPFFSTIMTHVNGMMNDLLTISLIFPFIILPIFFVSAHKFKKYNFIGFMVFLTCFWTWASICEWFFWDEFSSRFNFIAVDYLIYTKEVVGNIQESFSLPLITLIFLIIATVLCTLQIRILNSILNRLPKTSRFKDWVWAPLFISVIAYTNEPLNIGAGKNLVLEELGKNGPYEFFSAFRNNEINFNKMYANIDETKMEELIRREWNIHGFASMQEGKKIFKKSLNQSAQKRYNLIFIAVESLGAKFIGPLSNKKDLTPYLNKLSEKSLFFSNIYATGTRTVRGLEALTLSLPPTPGASIVRRPKNFNLMSIGRVFQKRDYETKFIYGGHGIFDNMNAFFRNNNYQIVDRPDFEKDEITFSNVWGVADENLMDKVLKESDLSFAKKKNFFSMVLTTSNHRPFTYPDGKIDIPSHTSRDGAVKYTDYALGTFLEKAEKKPWFKDTVIVIVADHSTDGRGVIDVPVETYHIPLFIYAPDLITPQVIDRVASQIDVIPTVLEIMGIRVDNIFFGRNILEMKKEDERFFVGTYQKVGMYKDGNFVSLGPKKTVQGYDYDPATKKLTENFHQHSSDLIELTQSYYQYASFLYKHEMYNDDFSRKGNP